MSKDIQQAHAPTEWLTVEQSEHQGLATRQDQHTAAIRKQSPWGLWWLTVITLTVYYFIWYNRVNKELAAYLGIRPGAKGAWWSQLIPFFNFVGLSRTAKRVNAAHIKAGSSTRIGPFTTWFWAPAWFGSHTRYVQRRVNILHDLTTN